MAYKEVRYHYILENLLKINPRIKVIGIVRNPLMVLESFFDAKREFRSDLGWKVDKEWRYANKKNLNKQEEYFGYEKWKEVAKLFEDLQLLYPNRFYLLKYEQLLKNGMEQVSKLFEFCELEVAEQTRSFIQNSQMKQDDRTYSVYGFKKRDCFKYVDNEIIDFIAADLKANNLEHYVRV
ncbi:sulfotransferase [Francisellaceae bacterium]|nr:sulfotransferase [Francisellaceae bacterium]